MSCGSLARDLAWYALIADADGLKKAMHAASLANLPRSHKEYAFACDECRLRAAISFRDLFYFMRFRVTVAHC